MRLLISLICLLACPALASPTEPDPAPRARFLGMVQTAQSYDCRDVSCKRLRSCEEACFKLLQCGQRKRDGDNDGIPCENLCSRPCR